MPRSLRAPLTLLLVSVLAAGCAAPWQASLTAPPDEAEPFRPAENAVTAEDDLVSPRESERRTGSGIAPPETEGSSATSDEAALAEVINQLQLLGALDPVAQQKLLEDLKQAPREHWPLLTQQFRATLAFQKAQRSEADGAELPSVGAAPAATELAAAEAVRQPLTTKPLPSTALSTEQQASASPGNDDAVQTAAPGQLDPAATNTATQIASDERSVAATASRQSAAPEAVAQASYETAQTPTDWHDSLTATIRSLEANASAAPKTPDEIADHAALRLLYLAAGRRDDALRPIPELSPAEQEFWSQEVYGLAVYLDSQQQPDLGQRAAEAIVHLNDARSKLAEMGSLVVRNMAFCSEVNSYGIYTEFDKQEFKPGQEVLLYAEIENFKVGSTPKGWHTSLKSSYRILDSRGAVVAEQEFPATEEYCRNPRRDFFIRYFLFMPKVIYDGRYTLQLTIEDTLGQKVGQSSIEFDIKE